MAENELETVSEPTEQEEVGSEPVAQQEPEFQVPEKYKGKSMKQVFDELEHANKSMGRYANELGELRKLTDDLIKSQLKPEKVEAVPEVDFFEDPREAVRRQIESNPDLQEAKKMALQARQAQMQAEFQRRHPDHQSVLSDPEFADWVKKSKVRTEMIQRANAFDVDAADELFSTYKELKSARTAKQKEVMDTSEQESRDKSLKAASVDSGGSGESGKKFFRRSDILKLMMNPAKYREREAEILKAYQEGRVR